MRKLAALRILLMLHNVVIRAISCSYVGVFLPRTKLHYRVVLCQFNCCTSHPTSLAKNPGNEGLRIMLKTLSSAHRTTIPRTCRSKLD